MHVSDNHWEAGSHLHMLSYLTHPRSDPNVFLNALRNDAKPKLPHPLHIRFERERDVDWLSPMPNIKVKVTPR